MAELGLTSYLINLGNQIGYAEARYHSLLVYSVALRFSATDLHASA